MEQFLIVISITLLASISPGPDFILSMKNNLLYGLRGGILTAIGIGSGVLVHVAYCIAGIGLIISQSILLFNAIKIIGALYLLYLAYLLIRAPKQNKNIDFVNEKVEKKSSFKLFSEGFLANVLNPKATVFFLSVFTQVIDPTTSLTMQILMGFSMMGVVTVWFVIFGVLLNLGFVKKKIGSFQYYIEKIMGGLLAFVGIKIIGDTKFN